MTCSWAIHISQQIYTQGGTFQTTIAKPLFTRAKFTGCYHLLQSILQIETSQSIVKGSISIHIDNTKAIAIDIIPPGSGPYKFLLTDYDYAQAITENEHKLHTNHNMILHYRNIYSHLDNWEKKHKLLQKTGSNLLDTYLSKTTTKAINNACDEEATTYQQSTSLILPAPVIYMESYITINNILMPSNNFSNIYQRIQKHTYLTYLSKNSNCKTLTFKTLTGRILEKLFQPFPKLKDP